MSGMVAARCFRALSFKYVPPALYSKVLWNLLALVHKSDGKRNLSICSKNLGNLVTFGHSKPGHLVERQATDKCLSGLRFHQASRQFVTKDDFQPKHGSFR